MKRLIPAVLALAAAAAVWAVLWAAHASSHPQPALHTVYCSWHGGPAVGFVAGPGLGTGCPPGFRPVSGGTAPG